MALLCHQGFVPRLVSSDRGDRVSTDSAGRFGGCSIAAGSSPDTGAPYYTVEEVIAPHGGFDTFVAQIFVDFVYVLGEQPVAVFAFTTGA